MSRHLLGDLGILWPVFRFFSVAGWKCWLKALNMSNYPPNYDRVCIFIWFGQINLVEKCQTLWSRPWIRMKPQSSDSFIQFLPQFSSREQDVSLFHYRRFISCLRGKTKCLSLITQTLSLLTRLMMCGRLNRADSPEETDAETFWLTSVQVHTDPKIQAASLLRLEE